MRSTLFHIPNLIPGDPFGLPVFGVGWLLVAWVLAASGLAYWWSRREGSKFDFWSLLLYVAVVGGGIVFLLPRLLETYGNPPRLGLPIRAYGLFMVAAVLSGVLLAAWRARRMGIDPEVVYSLSMLMVISGIIGARAFFVIQYWDEFYVPGHPLSTLQNIFNVPKGGLVVYGAVLGSFPVGVWYLLSRRIPPLVIADIGAPVMLMGLALGRMGCFMNGCCYGGFCTEIPPAMTFPRGSPPFVDQQGKGWTSGVWLKYDTSPDSKFKADSAFPPIVVGYVEPGSPAEEAGVKVNDLVEVINGVVITAGGEIEVEGKVAGEVERKTIPPLEYAQHHLSKATNSTRRPRVIEIGLTDGSTRRWEVRAAPARSAPIHPTQLYAAIDAGLLALLLWVVYPFRRKDGEVTAIMFTLHPPSRFLLEIVRVDEGGQFGTELSISQWVSIVLFLIGFVIWWYVERQPRGSAVPVRPSSAEPAAA
jgi:phosphatidylglycerol:prolipoprotein diacylglycerol transferase